MIQGVEVVIQGVEVHFPDGASEVGAHETLAGCGGQNCVGRAVDILATPDQNESPVGIGS